jgi:hypothetical protein
MKKIISLLLAVVLIAGCGKSSVLPSSVPPPDITSYDDIKVSNPNNESEADNMPFWVKAGLIAEVAIGIIACGCLCYGIVRSEREIKRSECAFKRFEVEFACQMERWRSQVEEQRNHAGHQVNHPVYSTGAKKEEMK